jgi:hypothetical protein
MTAPPSCQYCLVQQYLLSLISPEDFASLQRLCVQNILTLPQQATYVPQQTITTIEDATTSISNAHKYVNEQTISTKDRNQTLVHSFRGFTFLIQLYENLTLTHVLEKVPKLFHAQGMRQYPKKTRLYTLFRVAEALNTLSECVYGNFIIDNLENSFQIFKRIPANEIDSFIDNLKSLIENKIIPVIGPDTRGMCFSKLPEYRKNILLKSSIIPSFKKKKEIPKF